VSRERVDVLIVGSGFGGAVTAYRLAELYAAAGVDPGRILVLERGARRGHTGFAQSMHIEHLAGVYELIQGQGAQIVVANTLGGGSALYLAASLRAPAETFERRDRRPGDGPPRRMWPAAISRRSLDPYYRRAELALRVRRPTWEEVSKSGGLWAAVLDAAGHTCDRVPLAINPDRCVNAKWCHTGCIFGAKNTLFTNYLASAERLGVRVRTQAQAHCVRQVASRPYRYAVTVHPVKDGGWPDVLRGYEIECKVLVLAAGAMNTPQILLRSRLLLPSLSRQLGKHVGVNGDHVAAIEFDPRRVRDVLGLPGYADFHKGKPITTMTYDFFAGRPPPATTGRASRSRRSSSRRSRTCSTTTGAPRRGSRPGGGSRRRRRSPAGRAGSSCSPWSRTPTTASSPGSRPCSRRPGARSAPAPARWRSACSTTASPSSRGACERPPTPRSSGSPSGAASAAS
jgi:choline dehydrogenase-like flavoprotein